MATKASIDIKSHEDGTITVKVVRVRDLKVKGDLQTLRPQDKAMLVFMASLSEVVKRINGEVANGNELSPD